MVKTAWAMISISTEIGYSRKQSNCIQ
jgi:hypothetical protein